MKKGDQYKHFKGDVYTFVCHAHPNGRGDLPYHVSNSLILVEYVLHHEGEKELALYQHPDHEMYFIDSHDFSYVVYEKDGLRFARPTQDFFAFVTETERRFTKL